MQTTYELDLTLLQHARDLAVSLAREAGDIQRTALANGNTIRHKGTVDLVTDADIASEQLISHGIRSTFPDHRLTGEEGATGAESSPWCWLVDPLDGTTNYAHKQPHWAVSICLEHKGEPVMGVIYDVPRDEMFTAIVGEGAFLNDRPVSVSKADELLQAIGATGVPTDMTQRERGFLLWEVFNNNSQAMRRAGAAALDMAWVACGRLDFYFERPINNWDISAGVIICREAGGNVTRYSGETYDINDTEICASNGLLHRQIVDLITAIAP